MPIKKTTNAADRARIGKLAEQGLTIKEIVSTVRIIESQVREVLKGKKVRKEPSAEVEVEVVGEEPATASPLTPQQKAAATKKANAAKAAAEEADTADFLD
jgi:hypothetical protein